MWTERKKQIGPSGLPVPITARQDTLNLGNILDGDAAGKEERHVD